MASDNNPICGCPVPKVRVACGVKSCASVTSRNVSPKYRMVATSVRTMRIESWWSRYSDVTIGTMASQITNLVIVYSTIYSGGDKRKHKSFASLAFVMGIHGSPLNFPHKRPATGKMFPFDDVIMVLCIPRHTHNTTFFLCGIYNPPCRRFTLQNNARSTISIMLLMIMTSLN